jgi:hypothetical protein
VTAPATGSADPRETELTPEEEPVTTGTLFLMIVFLMLIFGFWALLYGMLLHR